MATLNITEFRNLGEGAHGEKPQIPQHPGLAVQNVTFTTATQSSAFNDETQYIRLEADTECYYLVGSNPTVTTSNGTRIQADTIEYIGVTGGAKISVVTAA